MFTKVTISAEKQAPSQAELLWICVLVQWLVSSVLLVAPYDIMGRTWVGTQLVLLNKLEDMTQFSYAAQLRRILLSASQLKLS